MPANPNGPDANTGTSRSAAAPSICGSFSHKSPRPMSMQKKNAHTNAPAIAPVISTHSANSSRFAGLASLPMKTPWHQAANRGTQHCGYVSHIVTVDPPDKPRTLPQHDTPKPQGTRQPAVGPSRSRRPRPKPHVQQGPGNKKNRLPPLVTPGSGRRFEKRSKPKPLKAPTSSGSHLRQHHEQLRQHEADEAACRERDHPCKQHVLGNAPVHALDGTAWHPRP